MSILAILDQLSQTTKGTEKLAILTNNKDNQLLQDVIVAALNPLTKYYIKKIPTYTARAADSAVQDLSQAISELSALSSRKYTGGAAITYLTSILESVTVHDAVVIERIIDGDLKCGVNVSTVNKVWKDLIPDFPYMRCDALKSVDINKWPWDKGVYAQLKADGMYQNANYYASGDVEFVSRNGNPMVLTHFEELVSDIKAHFEPGTQTHGELLVERDGEILPREIGNGILNSVSHGGEFAANEKPVFLVWDHIDLAYATPKNKGTVPYRERYAKLVDALAGSKYIKVIETKITYSVDEAIDFYVEQLEKGLEGAVIKHPDGVWMDTTSKFQVKLKLVVDADLEIVEFTPGKNKNEKTFGAIRCKTRDGLLFVNISGFKDPERLRLHSIRDEVIGSIVAVKFNGILLSKTNKPHSLFLPRFIEIRTDKNNADSFEEVQIAFDSAIESLKGRTV